MGDQSVMICDLLDCFPSRILNVPQDEIRLKFEGNRALTCANHMPGVTIGHACDFTCVHPMQEILLMCRQVHYHSHCG
jgi:hypothetical protein